MKLAEKVMSLYEGKIPQEQLKRVEVRKEGRGTAMEKEASDMGLKESDIIGWFSTKYNPALGYIIFKATDYDKKEFGSDTFRVFSCKTNTGGIAKFNIKTGVVSMVDNNAYEQGDIDFGKPFAYTKLVIDSNKASFDAFNII